MTDIVSAARELARAVDGVDWDAAQVEAAVAGLQTAAASEAGDAALDDALEVLVERLARARVDDCDGVAHLALSAGALAERGASARRLGTALVPHLVPVLRSARRYADRCLRELPADEDDDADGDEGYDAAGRDDVLVVVDDRSVTREVFRSGLEEDRPGACALFHLERWVLPSVSALTRDRELLAGAVADGDLVAAVGAMVDSDAHWLDVLLGVELDQVWLVLCPSQGRGFRVTVDGVVDNFTLHALLADALGRCGIPTGSNPAGLVDFVRGVSDSRPRDHVEGSFNLYDYRAAGSDVTQPMGVPQPFWVWGEGRPHDVPFFDGTRTLVVGPPGYARSWSADRTFWALPAEVRVTEELTADEVQRLLHDASHAAT